MAVTTQLFFQRPNNYGIESAVTNIIFDLNLGETHNRNSNITEHNIEDGSIIADHIQNQLENGSLTGYITNYSIFQNGLLINRAQETFDQLERLWKEKTLVTMLTVLKKYEKVGITGYTVAKSNSNEDLTAQLTFKKMNIKKLQEIEITADITIRTDNKNSRQTNPSVNTGRQTI